MLQPTRLAVSWLLLVHAIDAPASPRPIDVQYVEVGQVTKNLLSPADLTSRSFTSGAFYVHGSGDPRLRIEVQTSFHTVQPDFHTCGRKSVGYDKPVALIRLVTFRVALDEGKFGVLAPAQYENMEDPASKVCKWEFGGLVARAYLVDTNELIGLVRFEKSDRAKYVSDPRPAVADVSVICREQLQPIIPGKPRCRYLPSGDGFVTHFILSDAHTRLVHTAEGYAVKAPIGIAFDLE
jgi:hypothetical protein